MSDGVDIPVVIPASDPVITIPQAPIVITSKKRWFESKMVWVNGLALVAGLAQIMYGKEVIPAGDQATILTFINLVLRVITKDEVTW